MEKWEMLAIPFKANQVKWRVARITKSGDKAQVLAYIDARDVMDRLDKVVGVENWKDHYSFEGSRVICHLSIRKKSDTEWITKEDCAGDTQVEGEKGGMSDAFKRAAVKFGINRDMYAFGTNYAPINKYKQIEKEPDLPKWYNDKLAHYAKLFKAQKSE